LAAVELLLGAGIPAAPVVAPPDVPANEQLVARGFFEHRAHPVVGSHNYPGIPIRFDHAHGESGPLRSAPTLGQDNDAVLQSVLGVTEAELDRLRAAEVIGERPIGV
jgi:crotonobetainyl-CoA:carnitine CoA-transferase CaiB-like acyl-CoA transferase